MINRLKPDGLKEVNDSRTIFPDQGQKGRYFELIDFNFFSPESLTVFTSFL